MPLAVNLGLDIVIILVAVLGLYFPRHRRRDMVVAYLVTNIGLVAITSALTATGNSAGLGFGLFGVLSIIRLRSEEMDQPEVAYYFAAITLGLLGGLELDPAWIGPTLMAAILIALFVGDLPQLHRDYRSHVVTLDDAVTDEGELRARLEDLLGAKVHRVAIRRVDLVEDTTVVEVRYELLPKVSPRLGIRREPEGQVS
jgi:hypothetical protein